MVTQLPVNISLNVYVAIVHFKNILQILTLHGGFEKVLNAVVHSAFLLHLLVTSSQGIEFYERVVSEKAVVTRSC